MSGDSITTNDLAYPRRTCAAGKRDGHGWVYIDATNDVKVPVKQPAVFSVHDDVFGGLLA